MVLVLVGLACLLGGAWLAGKTIFGDRPDPGVVARGRAIYEGTESGIGCAFCHGRDGRGKGNATPDIRGKTASEVLKALRTSPQMDTINLTEGEVRAVAAYLKVLDRQP